MVERNCGNCRCSVLGEGHLLCQRYPRAVVKTPSDFCFEHQRELPSEEILNTDIALLKTTPRTRRICSGLHIKTVEDLLLVGRRGVTVNGIADLSSVRELCVALDRLGVDW